MAFRDQRYAHGFMICGQLQLRDFALCSAAVGCHNKASSAHRHSVPPTIVL